MIIIRVTKFSESKAFKINKKIIPKASDKEIRINPKKIFNVNARAKNKVIRKGKSW